MTNINFYPMYSPLFTASFDFVSELLLLVMQVFILLWLWDTKSLIWMWFVLLDYKLNHVGLRVSPCNTDRWISVQTWLKLYGWHWFWGFLWRMTFTLLCSFWWTDSISGSEGVRYICRLYFLGVVVTHVDNSIHKMLFLYLVETGNGHIFRLGKLW